MLANRMETTQTAGSAKDDPDVDANNGNGNGNGEGKTKKKPSALLAWLPMIISMVAMPLLAYATTSFLLLPKLQQEQGSPAHAAAAADVNGGVAHFVHAIAADDDVTAAT